MVDVLVEVIGGDEMALLLIEDAALIQAVQPDVAGDVLIPSDRRILSFWLSVRRSSVLKDLSNRFISFQLPFVFLQHMDAVGKHTDDAD